MRSACWCRLRFSDCLCRVYCVRRIHTTLENRKLYLTAAGRCSHLFAKTYKHTIHTHAPRKACFTDRRTCFAHGNMDYGYTCAWYNHPSAVTSVAKSRAIIYRHPVVILWLCGSNPNPKQQL